MNKKEFDKLNLRFVIDRSNFLLGWESCLRELEKVTGKTLDQLLKEK